MPVKSLKPNDWNPNVVPDDILVSIVAGIHKHGFVGAVLVWKGRNIIIDGEHRWIAAKKSGLTKIPIIELEVDEARARELTIAFNQKRGFFDPDRLTDVVQFIADKTDAARKDLQVMLGFSAKEIDGMLHDAANEAEKELSKKIKEEGGNPKVETRPPPPPLPPPPGDPEDDGGAAAAGDSDSAPGYGDGAPTEENPTGKFPFTFYAPSMDDYERMRDLFYSDGEFSFSKLNEMLESAVEHSQAAE